MSERCPRSIFRISPRLYPVRRTISLIAIPSSESERMTAFVSSRRTYPSYFLGKGQKRRIDHRGPHRRPDLPHGLSDSVKKGAARVFHQMPAVSNLNCVRKRPVRRDCITAATISSDDADLRLLRQPSLGRGRLPIRQ